MRNMIMTAVETRAARHIDGFKRMKLIRATAAIAAALAVVSCGDSREEMTDRNPISTRSIRR